MRIPLPRALVLLVILVLGPADPARAPVRPADLAGPAPLSPEQQRILDGLDRGPHPESAGISFCWSPDTDPETASMFSAPTGRERTTSLGAAYYLVGRWSATATDGPGLQQGDPTTLTWGILPDGVIIRLTPTDPGEPSRLIQVLDAEYGAGPSGDDLTQRPWFGILQQVFDRWSFFTGIDYVYEPDDDGAAFPSSAGVLGVRPDVRIGSRPIDGNSGPNIFGFNYFPNSGDMVLDSDNAPTFGSTAGNSIILRNLLAHEHGHGIGLAHTCPVDNTKLMEPLITTDFDGPQHDDAVGAGRMYGDRFEFPLENDSFALASDLGTPASGDTLRERDLSIDGGNDEDFFGITALNRTRVTVTMTPVGFRYLNSPEVDNPPGEQDECPLGQYRNTRIQNNLGFQILAPNGVDVLRNADFRAVGQEECVENFLLEAGDGTYFIRVYGDTSEVQLYDLEIGVSTGEPPVAICKDVSSCNSTVSPLRLNNGSYDPDDDPLTFTAEPPGPYAPGSQVVKLIVFDGILADTCEATVTITCGVPVELLAFSAERTGTGAIVRWESASAEDHAGFHLYRSEAPGPRIRISDRLLAGRARYEFEDGLAPQGDLDYWLEEVSRSGESSWHGPVRLQAAAPGGPGLTAVNPNPFASVATIGYTLAEPSPVVLDVYDARGRRVAVLVEEHQGAGDHRAAWNGGLDGGGRAPSGLYFIRLRSGDRSLVRKVVFAP